MKYKVMIVEDQTMPRELFELRVQASERFELALSIDNAALADVYCLRFLALKNSQMVDVRCAFF